VIDTVIVANIERSTDDHGMVDAIYPEMNAGSHPPVFHPDTPFFSLIPFLTRHRYSNQ